VFFLLLWGGVLCFGRAFFIAEGRAGGGLVFVFGGPGVGYFFYV